MAPHLRALLGATLLLTAGATLLAGSARACTYDYGSTGPLYHYSSVCWDGSCATHTDGNGVGVRQPPVRSFDAGVERSYNACTSEGSCAAWVHVGTLGINSPPVPC